MYRDHVFPFLIGRIRTINMTILISFYLNQFPFLIGRIRTDTTKHKSIKVLAFPFLIGRIRTYGFSNSVAWLLSFPFLIGRIRTLIFFKVFFINRFMFPFLIGRIRTKIANLAVDDAKIGFHSS